MSKSFDELLTFPTLFIYRIIAYQSDAIVQDCTDALISVFETIEGHKIIPSKSGKFVRIQIAVTALNSAQIYRGYDMLRTVDGIRMVF